MVTLGHLSDLHATPVRPGSVGPLLNKRFFGWLSWKLRRGRYHRGDVLEALIDDLRRASPDHVAVTGDLTNISLKAEFPAATEWLERIGGADRVSLVPGNHDAYVAMRRANAWDHWTPYMKSDAAGGAPDGATPWQDEFPCLRIRGCLALVGVCSAWPTAPFRASGRVGEAQLRRLERLLHELADTPLFRVLLIHHPVVPGIVARRRALSDAPALCDVIERVGVDLVIHGHTHRRRILSAAGPRGPIPVVGVRSASDRGGRSGRRAQYHLYEIEPCEAGRDGRRFRVRLRVRGYDASERRFVEEGSMPL